MAYYNTYTKEQLAYMKDRDRYLPKAELKADSEISPLDYKNEDDYKAAWNSIFHAEMNRLWKAYVAKRRFRK